MKKSKLRNSLSGAYLEWPKTMDWEMIRALEHLPADTVISVVCTWEDAEEVNPAQALSHTRRQVQEKEYSMTPISRLMFVVQATLRFIQCLLSGFNVRALNIDTVISPRNYGAA